MRKKLKSKTMKPSKKKVVSPDRPKAETYGRKIAKDYGPVTVIRAITQKFPSMRRGDVLAVADKLGVNQVTASGQYQATRSGRVKLDLRAL